MVRLRIAEMQKLMPSDEVWDFLWVTDFPLFEWSAEDGKWNAMHHPFTRPKTEDMALFEAKKFSEVRAEACASLGEVLRKYPRAALSVKQGVEREQKRAGC